MAERQSARTAARDCEATRQRGAGAHGRAVAMAKTSRRQGPEHIRVCSQGEEGVVAWSRPEDIGASTTCRGVCTGAKRIRGLSRCEGGVGVGADGPARSDDGGPSACLLAKGGRSPGDWQDARRMILRMGAAARCHGHDHGLFTLSYLIVSTYVDNYPKGSVEQNQILFGIRGRPHLQSKSQHK